MELFGAAQPTSVTGLSANVFFTSARSAGVRLGSTLWACGVRSSTPRMPACAQLRQQRRAGPSPGPTGRSPCRRPSWPGLPAAAMSDSDQRPGRHDAAPRAIEPMRNSRRVLRTPLILLPFQEMPDMNGTGLRNPIYGLETLPTRCLAGVPNVFGAVITHPPEHHYRDALSAENCTVKAMTGRIAGGRPWNRENIPSGATCE